MIGWGWFYLSTILDDFSRYIIACTIRNEGDNNAGWYGEEQGDDILQVRAL